MESLRVWARHGEAVRQAIAWGEMAHSETASAEGTDACLLVAIARGLLKRGASAWPAPRRAPAMPRAGLWPAPIAARFAGLSAMRKAGEGLRAARLCGALGDRGAVVAPEPGVSVRGTSDDTRLSGDVARTLVGTRAQQADRSPPAPRLPQEPRGAVHGRERASRRAVQQARAAAAAAARASQGAAPWVGGDHQQGGGARLQDARRGRGRRRHLLETPPMEVA